MALCTSLRGRYRCVVDSRMRTEAFLQTPCHLVKELNSRGPLCHSAVTVILWTAEFRAKAAVAGLLAGWDAERERMHGRCMVFRLGHITLAGLYYYIVITMSCC